MAWEVTAEALAQGARGATTEIFCPVQGFFQVPLVSDLEITVSPSRFSALLCLVSRCLGGTRPAHYRLFNNGKSTVAHDAYALHLRCLWQSCRVIAGIDRLQPVCLLHRTRLEGPDRDHEHLQRAAC